MQACGKLFLEVCSMEDQPVTGKAIGAKKLAQSMTLEQRKARASKAASARWAKEKPKDMLDLPTVPKATLWGELQIGEKILPCYHLENDVRVFSLKGVVVSLMDTEGGQLAEYIKVKSLRPFLPNDLVPAENDRIPALIQFDTGSEGFTQFALGLPVEKFIDLCDAYSKAAEVPNNLTERQQRIAVSANGFLRACAKVGIIALVDEATGYQARRPIDELQIKLKLFLAEEMRKWEKTFPDDLWVQFGRLTNWKGTLHQRPKYWGKLVMELIYEYLDPDVAQWLRENKPKPVHGQNYFQWMNEQYGLKKLIEHIWKVIGVASVCQDMPELKRRMEELYGKKTGFQFELRLSAPKEPPSA
jgi:P63C domain